MDLSTLTPAPLWRHFLNLCALPHPSGHEEQVAAYLLTFAKEKGLEAHQEACGNVIILKDASEGYEKSPRVILQAHMDMVPVAAPGVKHDFLRDPIHPVLHEDGTVTAQGTTLGADDGIGIATMLALLEDESLEHGPLTCIFTVEEETTMKGATGLDPRWLKGDYLINLDSEDTGLIFVGCAGSCDIHMTYRPAFEELPLGARALTLNLTGLKGGHSGTDIHKGHGNAIVLLSSLLSELNARYALNLVTFSGGQAVNSIPASATATVVVDTLKANAFKQDLLLFFEKVRAAHQEQDPGMRLEITEAKVPLKGMSSASLEELTALVDSFSLGALAYSAVDASIVQDSCNLGLISTVKDEVHLTLMPRSLDKDSLPRLVALQTDNAVCRALGDKLSFTCTPPHGAWLSPSDNALIRTLKQHWQEITGTPLTVTVLHAGLECGFFVEKGPASLQLISIGATIAYPHSPDERLDSRGAAQILALMQRTLAHLK